jgi:hypothetical protein
VPVRAKTLLLAIIVLITLWGISILGKGADMASSIKVTPSKSSVKVGEIFTVTVEVTPDTGVAVAGLQMDVGFNPAAMKVVTVVQGPFLGTLNFFSAGVIDNVAGTVKPIYGVVTTPGVGISAKGVFLILTCTALKAGETSALTLTNVIVGDLAGTSVPFSLSVSQVAVLSGYDLDGNGSVNAADLALAAAQFGGTGTADFNADGVVNILDLILVVKNFTV